MSLFRKSDSGVSAVTENDELVQISESDMVDLVAVALYEGCSVEELEGLITEGAEGEFDEVVTEKTIVKLDKAAKKNQAFKLGLLQVAREENKREYRKLVKLWKMEAVLMKKLEKDLRGKAEKRARELFKVLTRSKKPAAAKTGAKMLRTSTKKLTK